MTKMRDSTLGTVFIDAPDLLAPIVVGQRDLLLAGLASHVELFDPWKNEDVADFATPSNQYPYAFVDLDRDGDGELIAIDEADPVSLDLIIHNGSADSGPSPEWHDLNPRDYRDPGGEIPFIKTGRAEGRVLVIGADWELTDDFPIRVAAVGCED